MAAEKAARSAAHPAEGRRLQIKTLRRQGTRAAAASPLRCRPGLTGRYQTEDNICPGEERENVASQGRDWRRMAVERLQQASRRQSPPVPRGVWGQEQSPYGGQRPPPDRRSRLSAPSPDPGYRIREVETRRGEAEGDGAAEDRCKGTEQAWRITARSYRVDLRRRGTSGASARSEKGVFT